MEVMREILEQVGFPTFSFKRFWKGRLLYFDREVNNVGGMFFFLCDVFRRGDMCMHISVYTYMYIFKYIY